ncbi:MULTISPECIES: helix-turn-helix domain-containing protein [Nocardia]|uniref:helix-turn-helix domain-containing protein n=1 Tax=Nocardia TaxID=1817 RepID=UPI0007EA4682|nr:MULTISPECIES: helix-turn-helix domain-containing protein [Nocardia]MBF6272171.1 helix-turn-helix domain-containing protein [Nocardia nova]OBA44181.1 DNA-binding protein [Nocardia sp. 852002-51101_SCH5132738]OBB50788.1 DNA-binding protein [Nocardia sp. 852002-51244_SCH5132740]OBF71903.1 DNA-binding protein [Mycobacterium sp. 852002-51759_SCH5129042]
MEVNGRYVDVEGAALYLGTGVRFVRRLVAERRVVFYKIGGHVRFKLSDLEEFAQAGRVDPVSVQWHGGKAVA